MAAPIAHAQVQPTPAPTVQAIPGVLPERFRLPGTPEPTPTPTPTATPGPLVTPVTVPTQPPRASPTAAPKPRSTATPRPTESPTPVPTSSPVQVAPVSPPSSPTPSPVAPAPVPASSPEIWPWLAGAASLLVVLAAGWLLVRRRSGTGEEQREDEPAAPVESVAVAPPPAAAQGDPFAISLASARIQFAADAVAIDLELELTNAQTQPAEGIRPALALVSASPDQDRWCAAFHAGPPPQSEAGPIDLGPGMRIRLPARLTLRRDQVHVVQLGNRPMFVAMLMLDLRWRSGLSVRRFGADFLLGSAGQGTKPGPIWLDRPAPAALAASRYRAQASA